MNISEELKQHVADNPHIEKVYFDKAGNHFFHGYESDGKLYSRIQPPGNIEESRDYEITETLTRGEILAVDEKWLAPDKDPHIDLPDAE